MTSSRIRQLRTQAGLRQEEFAVLLGVGIATIARWESPQGTLPTGLPRSMLDAMDRLERRGVGLENVPDIMRDRGHLAAVRWILNQAADEPAQEAR